MSKKSVLIFTKKFSNDKYELLFNEITGFEILRGINGFPDPFSLELPSLLDIGIMGTCQNKCKFCYQGHINRPNMKLDDFKKIIDQTKHHVSQVALGGRGDPNKHENFKEILVYCRENKVAPNYTTSGINLTKEEIESSKLCGAIGVSDYGKDHTFKAINDLIEAGIKVCIHLIYSKESHDKVIQILNGNDVWNGKVNIDKLFSVLFLLFKPQGSGKNLDWSPTGMQLKEFSKHIFKPKSKFLVGIDSCLVNKVLYYEQPDKIQSLSIDTCEGARQSAYITPDMKMMPCSFANPEFFAIDITENQDIYNIWNHSQIFNKFRNQLLTNPRKCPLF
jgi:MoaA/NifB/PqqE/SkfB family radical SAM enzyme